MLLEGIFLPVTTPFLRDGRVFLPKLRSNVEHYSRTPVSGLIVLSEVGEADSLTEDETVSVLREAVEAASAQKVMIASVGRESVFATLALAARVDALHYDAIAVRAPAFAGDAGMKTELMTYFRAVADAATIPVVLVSDDLSVEVLAELAGHPRILGVLDLHATPERVASLKASTAEITHQAIVTTIFAAATRRMLVEAVVPAGSLGGVAVLETRPMLKTRLKNIGFQILTGSTSGMLACWQAGASGAVPRLGPCAPQACYEVWQAFKDEDPPLAEEKQERLREVAGRMEGWAGVGALKYGCDFNGYYGGLPRLPLLGPTAAAQAELERELAGMRN